MCMLSLLVLDFELLFILTPVVLYTVLGKDNKRNCCRWFSSYISYTSKFYNTIRLTSPLSYSTKSKPNNFTAVIGLLVDSTTSADHIHDPQRSRLSCGALDNAFSPRKLSGFVPLSTSHFVYSNFVYSSFVYSHLIYLCFHCENISVMQIVKYLQFDCTRLR